MQKRQSQTGAPSDLKKKRMPGNQDHTPTSKKLFISGTSSPPNTGDKTAENISSQALQKNSIFATLSDKTFDTEKVSELTERSRLRTKNLHYLRRKLPLAYEILEISDELLEPYWKKFESCRAKSNICVGVCSKKQTIFAIFRCMIFLLNKGYFSFISSYLFIFTSLVFSSLILTRTPGWDVHQGLPSLKRYIQW